MTRTQQINKNHTNGTLPLIKLNLFYYVTQRQLVANKVHGRCIQNDIGTRCRFDCIMKQVISAAVGL